MKRNPFEAAHAERAEAVLVLQATEAPLNGTASTVEVAEPLALASDAGVNDA